MIYSGGGQSFLGVAVVSWWSVVIVMLVICDQLYQHICTRFSLQRDGDRSHSAHTHRQKLIFCSPHRDKADTIKLKRRQRSVPANEAEF